MSLRRPLLGRRLSNREQAERKIGAFEGVPAMGLDGLGSAAYGPEAALMVLIPLGAAGLSLIGPIIAAIVALLAILATSYWQTIKAYPNSGGAYLVSKTNLGVHASLIAAAAPMVDYVLNVAVGISAGVGALVSALPSLHPYILELCLAILAFVAIVNLRGTHDAGHALGQHELRRLPAAVPHGGPGRVLAPAVRARRATPGVLGGHPLPRGRRRLIVFRGITDRLIVFRGITDRLIPLFAIGAFLTFTMSQTGMVVHWRSASRGSGGARVRGRHHIHLIMPPSCPHERSSDTRHEHSAGSGLARTCSLHDAGLAWSLADL